MLGIFRFELKIFEQKAAGFRQEINFSYEYSPNLGRTREWKDHPQNGTRCCDHSFIWWSKCIQKEAQGKWIEKNSKRLKEWSDSKETENQLSLKRRKSDYSG